MAVFLRGWLPHRGKAQMACNYKVKYPCSAVLSISGIASIHCARYFEVVYIELRHLDVLHFVIEECRLLANGCTAKCGCIGLMLFHFLSYVWAQ